jgi:hypothetical protein
MNVSQEFILIVDCVRVDAGSRVRSQPAPLAPPMPPSEAGRDPEQPRSRTLTRHLPRRSLFKSYEERLRGKLVRDLLADASVQISMDLIEVTVDDCVKDPWLIARAPKHFPVVEVHHYLTVPDDYRVVSASACTNAPRPHRARMTLMLDSAVRTYGGVADPRRRRSRWRCFRRWRRRRHLALGARPDRHARVRASAARGEAGNRRGGRAPRRLPRLILRLRPCDSRAVVERHLESDL